MNSQTNHRLIFAIALSIIVLTLNVIFTLNGTTKKFYGFFCNDWFPYEMSTQLPTCQAH
jgi:hypothetical protein